MDNASNLKEGKKDAGTSLIITTIFLVLSLNLVYLTIKKLCIKFFSKDCECNSCLVKNAKTYVRSPKESKVSKFGYYIILFLCGVGCTILYTSHYSQAKDIYQNIVADSYEYFDNYKIFDPFEILEISSDASIEEIEKSNRRLKMRYLPEKYYNKRISQMKLKSLDKAYKAALNEGKTNNSKNLDTNTDASTIPRIKSGIMFEIVNNFHEFQNFILLWLGAIILISLALRFIFSQFERRLSLLLERKYHINGCYLGEK